MEDINENLAYDPIDPNELDYDDGEDEIQPLPARNMIMVNHPENEDEAAAILHPPPPPPPPRRVIHQPEPYQNNDAPSA